MSADSRMRLCTKCDKQRPIEEFRKCKFGREGLHPHCRSCELTAKKAYRDSAKGKASRRAYNQKPDVKERRREIVRRSKTKDQRSRYYNTVARFGLTREGYLSILESQDGKCLICGRSSDKETLCVDHCHASGKVRALLCRSCNGGLGLFKDNPTLLRTAALYLERYTREKTGEN